MKKLTSIVFAGLLAGSLVYSGGFARADDDDRRDIQRERRDMRQDWRQLEQLRRRRGEELREGDYSEARNYDRQIRQLENDIRRDRRELWEADRDDYRYPHHD